ncbi:MAG: helix-turn-helix transcriptional regulator, partial [Anaerolineae bacterium]
MNDQQNRTEPLLATKLYIPPVRPNLVSRPQLLDRLSAAIEAGCKLILVSAPAGFGKTTLLCQWIHADGTSSSIPVGWLSLDASDSDLSRFLTYLILALQAVDPAIGQSLPSALQGPQPPPVESLLTILINDLSALPDTPSLLILDDYHTVKASSVHQALGFLLEHLPPQVHLVVASRSDPPLPLARLRGRGQLFELRIEDLRFDTVQATILLDQASTGPLSLEQAAQLAARTEGWITGLQLAALSLQGRDAEYRSRFVK